MGNLAVVAVVALVFFALALPEVALGLAVYVVATVIIIVVAALALKVLESFV